MTWENLSFWQQLCWIIAPKWMTRRKLAAAIRETQQRAARVRASEQPKES